MIDRQGSIIIRTLARLLVPWIQLFALYVIMHGHSSPGGGFQGGVILAASFILLSIAYGVEEVRNRFPVKVFVALTCFGVFLYGAIGLVCLFLGANFLDYGILPVVQPRSMGMLGIEIGVGITVMAALVSIFYDLLTFE